MMFWPLDKVLRIHNPKHEVLVLAEAITSPAILEALVRVRKSGVTVEVVIAGGRTRKGYTEADYLANAGITVFADYEHKSAHNFILIDRRAILTGSFNWTQSAETRSWRVLKNNKQLFELNLTHYRTHRGYSVPYRPSNNS